MANNTTTPDAIDVITSASTEQFTMTMIITEILESVTNTTDNINASSTAASPVAVWTWDPISWEWWQVVQLILAIVGILGNFLVMLVLFRSKRIRCSTDTLIAGLAMADFLTSIFIIPHDQVRTLPNTFAAQLYCRFIHSSILMWISICASIFTLTTISIERFMAVVFPFKFQRVFTPKSSIIGIAIMWGVAFIINTYSLYITYIDGNMCVVRFPSPAFQKFMGVSLFLVEYLLPVIVMICAHILTIRGLRKQVHSLTSRKERNSPALKLLKARRRVIELLFIVVLTFIISWTPDQFGFLAFNLGLVDFTHLYSPLYRTFVVLAFVNSCANPIIYAARNPNFRSALKELFGFVPKMGLQSVFAGIEDSRTSVLSKSVTHATELPTLNDTQM